MAGEALENWGTGFLLGDESVVDSLGDDDLYVQRSVFGEEIPRCTLVELMDRVGQIEGIRLAAAPATKVVL